MMNNIFSMFDPSNILLKTFFLPIIFLIMIPIKMMSNLSTFIKTMVSKIFNEMKPSLNYKLTSNKMMCSIFMTILLSNIFALLPFTFTMLSQASLVFPMALTCWLSIILYSSVEKTNKFLSHMVPSGSPEILIPALTIIELISNIIRPITLSIRLMANLTAGHLLMHLLSDFSLSFGNLFFLFIPISLLLSILETAVAMIQAYIFSTLLMLYHSEIH